MTDQERIAELEKQLEEANKLIHKKDHQFKLIVSTYGDTGDERMQRVVRWSYEGLYPKVKVNG